MLRKLRPKTLNNHFRQNWCSADVVSCAAQVAVMFLVVSVAQEVPVVGVIDVTLHLICIHGRNLVVKKIEGTIHATCFFCHERPARQAGRMTTRRHPPRAPGKAAHHFWTNDCATLAKPLPPRDVALWGRGATNCHHRLYRVRHLSKAVPPFLGTSFR